MDPLTITGRIVSIGEIQDFASGFRKRSFAVKELIENYPQEFGMEFHKDKVLTLEQFQVGDIVTVSANLRGNEHNGKYYVSLQAWKIALDGAEERRPSQNGAPAPKAQPVAAMADGLDEDFDDVPF